MSSIDGKFSLLWENPRTVIGPLNSTLSRLAVVLLYSSVFIIFAQILSRQLGLGLEGSRELATVLVIWVIFISILDGAVNDGHIHVSYFFDKLSTSIRISINKIVLLINITTLLILSIGSISAIVEFRDALTPSLQMPTYVLYFAVTVGTILLSTTYMLILILTWVKGEVVWKL